jgi:hypothetical protein
MRQMGAFLLSGFLLAATGCATRRVVSKERALDATVERPTTATHALTASLSPYGDEVRVRLEKKTTHVTYGQVKIRTGHRYVEAKKPAIIWTAVGASTALMGLLFRYMETRQGVERMSYVQGEDSQTPEVRYRTRPAKSRVGSSTFLIGGGALTLVGIGQAASPFLPATGVTKRIDERFQSQRLASEPRHGVRVDLRIGETTIASGQTDGQGEATIPLVDVDPQTRWTWTATLVAVDTLATADLNLHDSRVVGEAAGRWASRQITEGHLHAARTAVEGIGPHHPAFEPTWSGFCSAAVSAARVASSPGEGRLLKPPIMVSCAPVTAALSTRAIVQIRGALKRSETALAREWLPLVSAEETDKFQLMVQRKQDRMDAAEEAAERAAIASEEAAARTRLRRQRQSWQSRTNRALATCKSMQSEIFRRKNRVQSLARSGNVGAAQTEMDRFQDWMERTGQPRLGGALEDIQDIQREMEGQDVSREVMMPWMYRVKGACEQRRY